MALSNINNLDALDGVANIGASGETAIKEFLKELFFHTLERRQFDLFVGQMQAEGFAVATPLMPGDLRAVVQSPTVRVRFIRTGALKTRVEMDLFIDSAWKLVSEITLDGTF